MHYRDIDGIPKASLKSDLLAELERELAVPRHLSDLGIPVEVVVPLMDHEIRRPDFMFTAENRRKVQKYLHELKEYYQTKSAEHSMSITTVSGSDYFGMPTPASLKDKVMKAIKYTNMNEFSIPNHMYENAVADNTERFKSMNVLPQFMSNEIARLYVDSETCDGVYMARQMVDAMNADTHSGVLALMPRGAGYLHRIYKAAQGLILYADISYVSDFYSSGES
jgi:hypothetical protein